MPSKTDFFAQIRNLGLLEAFLIQSILYLLIWMISDYVGFLITIIMATILLGILVISLIAEIIERSKISRRFFYFLLISVLAPVAIAIGYGFIIGFSYDWPSI